MGHGYGTTLLYLFFKEGDDRAVTAQYIAETHRHKFRTDIFRHQLWRRFSFVGKQLRQPHNVLLPHRLVKGLNDHLTQTLAGAHNVGRIHRLIGADQHKALTAVSHCRIGGFVCTDYIILNRLTRACLH